MYILMYGNMYLKKISDKHHQIIGNYNITMIARLLKRSVR